MARMQSDRSGQEKISVRVDAGLKEDYQNAVDSMSGDLREHISEVAEIGETPDNGLEDAVLSDAYTELRRGADPHTNEIDVEVATSMVAEAAQVPKKAVQKRVLRPLEREGYITPRWGTVVVHPPEVVAHP